MTTLREAAVMALEALNHLKTREPVDKEITALRAALASQTVTRYCSNSHQPDSWRSENRNDLGLPVFFCASEVKQAGPGLIPLYTAPPQRNPLTDEHNPQYQIIKRQGRWQLVYDQQHHEFRIIKLRHDIWLYPGIELIQAHKRFFEHVENDNE